MGRAASHARVGCRLEAAWSERLDAIAAELAEHFGAEVLDAYSRAETLCDRLGSRVRYKLLHHFPAPSGGHYGVP
jgi:hypothetical protein